MASSSTSEPAALKPEDMVFACAMTQEQIVQHFKNNALAQAAPLSEQAFLSMHKTLSMLEASRDLTAYWISSSPRQ